MKDEIRPFMAEDIPLKVRWINDPANNQFLHSDIPIQEDKTRIRFEKIKDRDDRYDATILADDIPCGTIGLLSIDRKNSKAEFYVAMGEISLKGKGVSTKAGKLVLEYAFRDLGLNRVYLFTETGNIPAQKLFEKIGFLREGCLKDDIWSHGHFADRYVYGVSKKDYLSQV